MPVSRDGGLAWQASLTSLHGIVCLLPDRTDRRSWHVSASVPGFGLTRSLPRWAEPKGIDIAIITRVYLALALTLLAGCGSSSGVNAPPPLAAGNVNLIFVVSPDLTYNAPGDVDPNTANLTNQGLQRSLLMATFLKQQVLGANNVNGIYALEPMTHPQTALNYPDMTALGYIQQFALLNQITLTVDGAGTVHTGNNFPINTSYALGSVPSGVAPPTSASYCPACGGLEFNDTHGNNGALASAIINASAPGYHVFSAPWETISALMANIDGSHAYHLKLPGSYMGPNHVYAISIAPSGAVRLVDYDSKLNPPVAYPMRPSSVASASCSYAQQAYFSVARTGGVDGALVPGNINANQTVYIVRHAEAHPDIPLHGFEDGNFVAAGQWRALDLPNALRDKIHPDVVYSIDPAQWYRTRDSTVSYVRASLTVFPYAIANNLPYFLVSTFQVGAGPADNPVVAQQTVDFLFTNGNLSNQTVLLAWESAHIRPFLNELIARYGGNPAVLPTAGPPVGGWPEVDYDTIWTVKLDAVGNLTVDDALCEGIDSTQLPATAPQL